MKAITIKQPYASLIACGAKRFETRSWKTNYRGKIAIHAGKCDMFDVLDDVTRKQVFLALHDSQYAAEDIPYGAIIAVAELAECWQIVRDVDKAVLYTPTPKGGEFRAPLSIAGNELLFGDFSAGRYAWELANVTPLPRPIPCAGKQGLWSAPESGVF